MLSPAASSCDESRRGKQESWGPRQSLALTPDKIDLGRRLIEGKDLFEVTIIPKELNKFCKMLHKVMDIGVVVELSILSDWAQQNGGVKQKLKERLHVLEKDLQLPYASLKV